MQFQWHIPSRLRFTFHSTNPIASYPHYAFSSNMFHGQIVQIAILQLSGPENKKCSPWKVFGTNHPQTLQLLSRRGPRSPDARLSQHYIGPKMTICPFLNFGRKNVFRLDNKAPVHFYTIFGVVIFKNHVARPLHSFNKCREPLVSSLETFFCRNLKNVGMSFLANVMLRQSRVQASRASPAQKSQGLRVVLSKNFSGATFFVFWAT